MPAFHKVLPGALQRFVAPASEKPAIDFAKRLRARSNVLGASIAHFDFLASKNISASYFANEVKRIMLQHKDTPMCLYSLPLKPKPT